MACCKCCCGGVDCTEGQEGKCCCGGAGGTCCDVGEYCCDGACQPAPCEELCGCFKDFSGTFAFTFLTFSGNVTNGYWSLPSYEYLAMFCTAGVEVCGVAQGDGLKIVFWDGTDYWEGFLAGDWTEAPCEEVTDIVGTYTLTNCTTSATATLTIT